MSNFASSPSVILKNVRLDYFDAWTPGAPMDEKDKDDLKKWKFKAKVILDPKSEAAEVARKAFSDAAQALWGVNYNNVVAAMSKNNKAIRNGNEVLTQDGAVKAMYVDSLMVSCSNSARPVVVGPRKFNGKFVDIDASGRAFQNGVELNPPPYQTIAPYRGCYVNLKVQFVAGKTQGKLPNQVYAKFEALQFVKDGEAFDNAACSAVGFDGEEFQPEETDENMFM